MFFLYKNQFDSFLFYSFYLQKKQKEYIFLFCDDLLVMLFSQNVPEIKWGKNSGNGCLWLKTQFLRGFCGRGRKRIFSLSNYLLLFIAFFSYFCNWLSASIFHKLSSCLVVILVNFIEYFHLWWFNHSLWLFWLHVLWAFITQFLNFSFVCFFSSESNDDHAHGRRKFLEMKIDCRGKEKRMRQRTWKFFYNRTMKWSMNQSPYKYNGNTTFSSLSLSLCPKIEKTKR